MYSSHSIKTRVKEFRLDVGWVSQTSASVVAERQSAGPETQTLTESGPAHMKGMELLLPTCFNHLLPLLDNGAVLWTNVARGPSGQDAEPSPSHCSTAALITKPNREMLPCSANAEQPPRGLGWRPECRANLPSPPPQSRTSRRVQPVHGCHQPSESKDWMKVF